MKNVFLFLCAMKSLRVCFCCVDVYGSLNLNQKESLAISTINFWRKCQVFTYMLRVRSFDPLWPCGLSWRRSLWETMPMSFIQGLFWVPWPIEPPLLKTGIFQDSARERQSRVKIIILEHYLATSSWCRSFVFIFPLPS